jgi:hypothetical protein
VSWEYRALRRRLRLPRDPLIGRFERFCEEAAADITRMEWSCKLAEGVVDQNRFVACATLSPGDRGAARAFARLLATTFAADREQPSGAAFRLAVTTHASTVFVGYAGGGRGQAPTLKAYVGWHGGSATMDGEILGTPGEELPGMPFRMIGRSIDANGRIGGRSYAFYQQGAEQEAAVAAWLSSTFGPHGPRLLALHPRFGLARKPGSATTLLAGLRPSGFDAPHPSHASSPLLFPVLTLAEHVPTLAERLERITWIAASPDVLSKKVGQLPDKLGVYTRLVS